MSDATRLLTAIGQGDPSAAEQLLPLVYDELRRLASQKLAHEKPNLTIQATSLVHEAYLRLVTGDPNKHWNGRAHFFGAAAEAMRRILIENARRKKREKHGGDLQRIDLDAIQLAVDLPVEDLVELDAALKKLAESDADVARLVELHCFAGLTIEQSAEIVGRPLRSAYRDWAYARTWLFRELRGSQPEPSA